jgi:Tfp pilus assembly protein PilX
LRHKLVLNRVQKGVSLYLAAMIMTVLLAIVLGLSTILLTQVKIVGEMEDSVIAFCAADSGIELVLNEGENATDTANYSGSLDSGAAFNPQVYDPGSEGCPADTEHFCIDSRGTYNGIQRAIQINR